MRQIIPCLWFNGQAEEAARFYTSLFKNSKIKNIALQGEAVAAATGRPAGSVLTVTFELNGQEFLALNGGPQFKFTEAVSFMVFCENQDEVDRYWAALTAGGEESQCGWLKDRYGLSWQVVPTRFMQMLQDPDADRVNRVMTAMMGMVKFDIAALERAYQA